MKTKLTDSGRRLRKQADLPSALLDKVPGMIEGPRGKPDQTVEQIFREFCNLAEAKGYAFQPAEDWELKEVRKQTEGAGLDPTVYQTFIIYITGKDKQKFSKSLFTTKGQVDKTKEQLFRMICEVMRNGKDIYAFLKHYREFSSEIQDQLQIPLLIALAHPHIRSHVSVLLEGTQKPYTLPDDEDKLPVHAFSADAERFIVGFNYRGGLPVAGRILLFDRPFYKGMASPPPRKNISIDDINEYLDSPNEID